MNRRGPLLLVAVPLVAIALALAVTGAPRAPEHGAGAGVWRYAAPSVAAGARGPAAGPAGHDSLIAQCLWPRAASSAAAGASRRSAAAAGIGHAFCLRAPGTAAHRDAGASTPPRLSYRT